MVEVTTSAPDCLRRQESDPVDEVAAHGGGRQAQGIDLVSLVEPDAARLLELVPHRREPVREFRGSDHDDAGPAGADTLDDLAEGGALHRCTPFAASLGGSGLGLSRGPGYCPAIAAAKAVRPSVSGDDSPVRASTSLTLPSISSLVMMTPLGERTKPNPTAVGTGRLAHQYKPLIMRAIPFLYTAHHNGLT